MSRKQANPAKPLKDLLQIARKLRVMLDEINQKIDHLIERFRRFQLADDPSYSLKSGFLR